MTTEQMDWIDDHGGGLERPRRHPLEAIRIELATLHLKPGDVAVIVAPSGVSPDGCRELREYARAVLPEGVSVLVLPHGSTLTKMTYVQDDESTWTGNEDER